MPRVVYYSALSESHYAIMTEGNLFVGRIEDGDVVLVEKVFDAVWFYNESAAYEMSLELQTQTHGWFGVVEI